MHLIVHRLHVALLELVRKLALLEFLLGLELLIGYHAFLTHFRVVFEVILDADL